MTGNKNRTKFVFLVGDGMGDYPLLQLGGKTPLEAAETPYMDRIASCRLGLVRTIPEGMEPGSDVANLSLMGYDPALYHSGRAPLEAASMGVSLSTEDVAFRMNLVTLDFRSDREVLMLSHSSGDIPTDEARELVNDLRRHLEQPGIRIYPGVAYRHLLVWEEGPEHAMTIPPHDVLDQNMAPYLFGSTGNPVPLFVRGSWDLLRDHPVNVRRRKAGLKEATSVWLWGQGRAPRMPTLKEKYGLNGHVISAVDLLRGIGIYAGLKPIYVEGATGYLNTNYIGKAEAALQGLEEQDFVFLHVEAPDEAGHSGNWKEKIEAIENFDHKVLGTVLEGMRGVAEYRIMVASDHLTPIARRTHTNEPAPFAWAAKHEIEWGNKGPPFTEAAALQSGLFYLRGHELMDAFIGGIQS